MNYKKALSLLKRYPLVVVLAILSAVCCIMISMRGGIIETLTEEEVAFDKELARATANRNNARDLDEDHEELLRLVQTIEPKLFIPSEKATNTDFFYSLDGNSGVSLSVVNQVSVGNSLFTGNSPLRLDLHTVITYTLSVKGSYAELLAFMDGLYQLESFIRVSNVQFSGAGMGDLIGTLRLHVLAKKS